MKEIVTCFMSFSSFICYGAASLQTQRSSSELKTHTSIFDLIPLDAGHSASCGRLSRIMGFSPPRGSLVAAPCSDACKAEVSLCALPVIALRSEPPTVRNKTARLCQGVSFPRLAPSSGNNSGNVLAEGVFSFQDSGGSFELREWRFFILSLVNGKKKRFCKALFSYFFIFLVDVD